MDDTIKMAIDRVMEKQKEQEKVEAPSDETEPVEKKVEKVVCNVCTISLQMPTWLRSKTDVAAKYDGRSRSAFIREALKDRIVKIMGKLNSDDLSSTTDLPPNQNY